MTWWRIEHDYRELKHGLGHFEARSFTSWYRASPSSASPRPVMAFLGGRLPLEERHRVVQAPESEIFEFIGRRYPTWSTGFRR